MYIEKVNIENFRNFAGLEINFNPGFVVLFGPNGAGKTNFLEALYLGLSLRRFPTSTTRQLFRGEEVFFRVGLSFFSNEQMEFEVFCERQERRPRLLLKVNGQEVSRSAFGKQVSVISFLPEDLNLLTHSPMSRRGFLDKLLSAASLEYRHNLSQYNQALKQRNIALEQKSSLDIWDEQLAIFGSTVTREREGFLNFLGRELEGVLSALSPELSKAEIKYQASGAADRAIFASMLAHSRARDEQKLGTSVGPHRDDFEVWDKGQTIVGWLSRGQLRAITLALKILERKYLEEITKLTPLILLDDVFSEFDSMHQQHLLEFLKTFKQVFLTTAHLEEIQGHLPADSQIYKIESGHVQQP